jgi:nucleoside-diphosphate-sugar epimerase
MSKAIVSGANGFIGHAVVEALINRGYEVVALISLAAEDPFTADVFSDVRTLRFDLGNPTAILQKEKCLKHADAFFNFAWRGVVGPNQSDASIQLSNVISNIEQIKLCAQIGCPTFVNAGSIFEFAPIYTDYDSDILPPSGTLIYGSAKLTAKHMGLAIAAELGLSYLQGTITNTYGPGERAERFIKSTLRKILRGESLEFTAATQMYDFVYISDLARAFCSIAECGARHKEFVIGSGDAQSLRFFIDELLVASGEYLQVEPIFGAVPFAGVDLPKSCFNIAALQNTTGFKPEISFREGVRRTLEWLKEDGR